MNTDKRESLRKKGSRYLSELRVHSPAFVLMTDGIMGLPYGKPI